MVRKITPKGTYSQKCNLSICSCKTCLNVTENLLFGYRQIHTLDSQYALCDSKT